MKSIILLFLVLTPMLITTSGVFAQQPQLATYRETANVLVDEKVQNKTTAFITLSTTSPLEMHVPTSLSDKINSAANVTAVAITNANHCVEGVNQQTCVVIAIHSPSLIESYNITKIQSTGKAVGDTLIEDINKSFLLNAQFFETFVEPKGQLSGALGTSGLVSGNRTIYVVYTADQQKSSYLFVAFSSVLLPAQISKAGGYYDVAKKMSEDNNSTVTFAMAPTVTGQSLFQLQVSKQSPIKGGVSAIRPLELFGVDKLERSSYFSGGFFPLNSLFELSVISNHDVAFVNHGAALVPTTVKNGENIPTDLSKTGWVFDPESGQRITAIYLFGTSTAATNDDLSLTIGSPSGQPTGTTPSGIESSKPNIDYSTYALIGIIVAGGGAIYLFMRRK